MGTKSKSDFSVVWSIIAMLIAIASIGYCFSIVVEVAWNGWERSTQLLSQIARIIEGTIG